MKGLLQIIATLMQLLVFLAISTIALLMLFSENSVLFGYVLVPVIFIVVSALAVFFDQTLISWRQHIADHRPPLKPRCRIKYCLIHNSH